MMSDPKRQDWRTRRVAQAPARLPDGTIITHGPEPRGRPRPASTPAPTTPKRTPPPTPRRP
ncbi:hypothetical protein K2Z83_28465 [Oscillochloris sp. ZM17-4]|uniref:hypothetical protein n=1 Tax=Oscillochloris sp. ZM17-4 TaxID=2866714 RepID=UPI001C736BAE|nr:hypothetical protein [Oscillochloris sp. ZM17-4]MBX0331590.1 hypothetical protein [Oscillochloris sp. ZM17-4]